MRCPSRRCFAGKAFLWLVVALSAALCGCAAQGGRAAGDALRPPPLPVLSPTALTADGGDGRVYLRWNPQMEDPRVVGWKVLQLEPEKRAATPQPLADPQFVVCGLANGTRYTFAIVGVLKDGGTTSESNTAAVTPHDVGTAKIVPLKRGEKIAVGEFQDVTAGPSAARVVFPDGQEIVYDQCRPVDWKARDGEHLIYPKAFGNGLDIGQFDERGLPKLIPPGGLKESGPIGRLPGYTLGQGAEYRDAQFGSPHATLTDPMTLPVEASKGDARRWVAWSRAVA